MDRPIYEPFQARQKQTAFWLEVAGDLAFLVALVFTALILWSL
jgi:hypothetical protein